MRGLTTAGRLSSALKKLDNKTLCGCLPRMIARVLNIFFSRQCFFIKLRLYNIPKLSTHNKVIFNVVFNLDVTDFCIFVRFYVAKTFISSGSFSTTGTLAIVSWRKTLQCVVYIIKHSSVNFKYDVVSSCR